jgi:hypothetical protein
VEEVASSVVILLLTSQSKCSSITLLKNNLYLHFDFLPVTFIKTSIGQEKFTQILLRNCVCELQRCPEIQSP